MCPAPCDHLSSPATPPLLDILFIGYGDWHLWTWDGFRTRSAQLCRFLASSPHVRNVYVLNEPVYLRSPSKGFSIPRARRFRLLPYRSRCYQVTQDIYAIDPSRFLLAPFSWRKRYVIRNLRKHLATLEISPVLWIANVPMAFLMNEIPCSLRVFDAIDDWEFIPNLRDNLKIGECYETISTHADIIFTVSEYLADKFKNRTAGPLVRQVPNGVDLGLFSRAADPPQIRRSNRGQKQPVLTYIGVLSDRFDFEIAKAVAITYPECRLLLVGPLQKSEDYRFKPLQALPNVEWRGLVHHSHIPQILRDSDVLLIPHCVSPLATSMDPLKLYEYMTTGLPIVATDVPPMKKYEQFVSIAKDPPTFVSAVEKALKEQEMPSAEWLWQARIEEAKRHSWQTRVEHIIKDMTTILAQKGKLK